MSKRPQPLNAALTRTILESGAQPEQRAYFLNHELGMAHSATFPIDSLRSYDTPFVVGDYRLGIVVQGEARGVVNLTEQRLTPGTIAFIGPGTIVQPLAVSPDFRLKGLILFPDFPLPFPPDQLPAAFNSRKAFILHDLPESDLSIAHTLLDAVWSVANVNSPAGGLRGASSYDRSVISNLVAAIFHHWNNVCQTMDATQSETSSRDQALLGRFIQLVDQHAPMNFPTPSFFGKFFRRMTGQTPQEYREGSWEPGTKKE